VSSFATNITPAKPGAEAGVVHTTAKRRIGMSDVSGDRALTGDQVVQGEVLEGLAEAHNHRRWFAALARPYLGDDPIEVGSGLGDYALEWAPTTRRFTATEADPDRLLELKARLTGHDRIEVRQLHLPTEEVGRHSALVTLNVLEHIQDDVEALRSMARLVRPGGPLVLVVPAFPIAMSRIDVATGHVRRYTKGTLAEAIRAAGLEVERIEYANSVGFLCYFLTAKVLGLAPRKGPLIRVYDRIVAPVTRWAEARVRPPFGQSVFAVARVPEA
jgi:SAM-dependent methyltransferase